MNSNVSAKFIEPYLFFEGCCEEAVEYYRQHLGAEVEMVMRYSESPEAPPPGAVPPGHENKIMHASLRIGGTKVMASDGGCSDKTKFSGFNLSLTVPTEAEADRIFNALADGGKVNMPMMKTFWSPRFGMVEDRFGVGWMITLPTA